MHIAVIVAATAADFQYSTDRSSLDNVTVRAPSTVTHCGAGGIVRNVSSVQGLRGWRPELSSLGSFDGKPNTNPNPYGTLQSISTPASTAPSTPAVPASPQHVLSDCTPAMHNRTCDYFSQDQFSFFSEVHCCFDPRVD